MSTFQNKPQPQVFGNKLKPDDSAQVEIESGGDKGLLLPRVTTVERLAIPAPAVGLEVFDTDLGTIFYFDGVVWKSPTGITGPTPVTDQSVVRYDGTVGDKVEDSLVTIDDIGEMKGATALEVDNLRLDGNEVTSLDVDGDIVLTPNGVGKVVITKDLQVLGTTTTVESDTLEVVDANITVNKDGNQASADAQGAGITVEMSDATDATLSYDSTLTSKFKVGEAGTEAEIATTTDVQDITNKRISNEASIPANLSFNQQSTTLVTKPWTVMTTAERDAVASPAQGYVVYNSSDNELQIFDGIDWLSYNIGVYFMIDNGYKRDFAASPLGTTFETIHTITGGTLKALNVTNNSSNEILVRVTASGPHMLIAPGDAVQIGYRGNSGDVVQIATVVGTADTDNLYINFLGV